MDSWAPAGPPPRLTACTWVQVVIYGRFFTLADKDGSGEVSTDECVAQDNTIAMMTGAEFSEAESR